MTLRRLSDEEWERQRAYWQPLYEGEKLAGLLPWTDKELSYLKHAISDWKNQ